MQNYLETILLKKSITTNYSIKGADEMAETTKDLSISEMLEMSQKLWELHKDTWSPMEPEEGKTFILYMIEEIGEAIAIIKKKTEVGIMNDPSVRERFIEELGDVLMYYSDVLNRFKITPEEFSTIYIKKFKSNMTRDFEGQYKENRS